jgi:seryl-tRNA synthetase
MEEAKDEISIKLEKQNLIKDEIINNGLDSIQFIEYLIQCKGPGGENINDWSITDLKHAINDFIYLNKNMNKNKNNSQAENKEQNKKENQIENEKEEGKEKEKNELSNNNKPLNSNINDKDVKENKVDMPAPVAPKEENLSKSVLKNILDISNNLFIDSSKKKMKK